MMGALLLIVPLVPLALALLIWRPGYGRSLATVLAPWAAVPALALSFAPLPDAPVLFPWLLLGTAAGLDATGRLFLLFTALLWTLAGLHARATVTLERHRYFFFHLLALCGNLGLIVAQDLASFYLFFALMTFSAYGLVVHDGTPAAFRAGRVYMAMGVLGETLLLAAFLLAASSAASLTLPDVRAAAAASPRGGLLALLLLAGFGIKAGAVPLHVWLPLAHPVAPTPASAVLSGCMIKAGLLGWLRFLPLGEAALPHLGQLVIALGLGAAFFGVIVGLTQRHPKAILAYSSVSQMGIVNTAFGMALANPEAWHLALPAIPLYALHHGLAKGALFLSVSVAGHRAGSAAGRSLVRAGLVLPALAMIGLPFTSGAVAKLAVKTAGAAAPGPWAAWLDVLLPLTAVATTLLMIRFFIALAPSPQEPRPPGVVAPWALAAVAAVLTIWIVPPRFGIPIDAAALLRPYNLWTASWPLAAGLSLAALFAAARRRGVLPAAPGIAPGDLLVLLEGLWARIRHRPVADVPVADVHGPPDPVAAFAASVHAMFEASTPRDRLGRIEALVVRWDVAGALALVVAAALIVLG